MADMLLLAELPIYILLSEGPHLNELFCIFSELLCSAKSKFTLEFAVFEVVSLPGDTCMAGSPFLEFGNTLFW